MGGLDELDGSFEIDDDLAFAHPTILSPERRSRDPLALPVLALNRHFHPVQVTTARRAFLLLFGGTAHAIDEAGDVHDFTSWRGLPVRDSDDGLPIVGGSLRVPRVLHLRRYERVRRPTVRLSRRNVMLRDAHQCQYCLKRPPVRDLNIDHVVPRSRGGVDSWENLVTACRPCNLRKGRRTPEEASMRLLRTPTAPRWSASMLLLLGRPEPFKEWEPFLKSA
ncbi:HNH endonuclease [Polyangium sorediatum]|uniref:HNH endonuclease n=1 Tax=Polyangium sorediatum TaxID=889274 RepID=A0ABT6NT44_9BACT|nr:HNH endonuclease [Polyangium sorediatum]MDI1431515.1 HNH endonuclease [Polyangium sorediatum]